MVVARAPNEVSSDGVHLEALSLPNPPQSSTLDDWVYAGGSSQEVQKRQVLGGGVGDYEPCSESLASLSQW